MALKDTDKLFKSSFTEDDVYFYSREDGDIDSKAEEFLNESDSSDPLWYLHPSDEDNRFIKLGDFAPKRWKTPGDFGAQHAA